MSGHLSYYIEHEISPVRYAMTSHAEHFERRDALYRALGLPPVAFFRSRVLEVAPGSGQNSLYPASCLPAEYTLVEPNPAGLRDIDAAYAGLDVPHRSPKVHPVRLEDFESEELFDIVLCENWLGSQASELKLIGKLAGMVAPGGVLVITAVPLAGFFPNVMRKLLALRLMKPGMSLTETTGHLKAAFDPHLSTIPNMTRSSEDWIQDCMINPHYLRVALPFETLVAAVGDQMDVLSSSPRFLTDWRWFKGMTGEEREYGQPFLDCVAANLPNFLDYRKVFDPLPAGSGALALSDLFDRAYRGSIDWEMYHANNDKGEMDRIGSMLQDLIHEMGKHLASLDPTYKEMFGELASVWSQPDVSPGDVAGMKKFGRLFGRETVYVSFTRRIA